MKWCVCVGVVLYFAFEHFESGRVVFHVKLEDEYDVLCHLLEISGKYVAILHMLFDCMNEIDDYVFGCFV